MIFAVLDPAVMAYDAYGLHHAADKPEREGHAISMMGRDDARAAIAGLHKKFTDRNKLLAFAVNPDQRVSRVPSVGQSRLAVLAGCMKAFEEGDEAFIGPRFAMFVGNSSACALPAAAAAAFLLCAGCV
jgi:hypothetical protein